MDPHTWPCKSRTTSTNIHSATMWGYRCCPEDLPEAMNDREKWRERVRDIRATSTTWWWWWWWKSAKNCPCVASDIIAVYSVDRQASISSLRFVFWSARVANFVLVLCLRSSSPIVLNLSQYYNYFLVNFFFTCLIHIYQPLRSGRIWHKVNFEAEFNMFEFRVFLLLD